MSIYQFLLGMVLAIYIGFSRLNHLRFLAQDPMLTGILQVGKLPPQCTFWRFLTSLPRCSPEVTHPRSSKATRFGNAT
jgi:hypothetical protein